MNCMKKKAALSNEQGYKQYFTVLERKGKKGEKKKEKQEKEFGAQDSGVVPRVWSGKL